MNLLLICFLYFTPIDTIPVKYLDTTWKDGFIIVNVTHKTDVYWIFDEPTQWLNSKKQPIIKPKKYHLTF